MLDSTAVLASNGSSSKHISTPLMPASTISSISGSCPKKASSYPTDSHPSHQQPVGGEVGVLIRELLEGGGLAEPLVFKGLHSSWAPLSWTLADWDAALQKNEKNLLPCRLGRRETRGPSPEWEWMSRKADLSWKELTQWTSEDWWAVYDYKHLPHVLLPPRLHEFDWSAVGFSERGGEKSNLWIGTGDAITPCHFDTYGANFVTQVYGHKEWILFPPENTSYLGPTRVPYEESSVYSSINFRAPSQAQLASLSKCSGLRVILEPGDVMFVPPKWWHSVSSLDFSISINTWIEIPEDRRSRVEEAVLSSLVASILSIAEPDTSLPILNPGQDMDTLEDMREPELVDILRRATLDLTSCQKESKPKLRNTLDDLFALSPSIHKLDPHVFSKPESQEPLDESLPEPNYLHALINAVGHPDVLQLITEKFLENIQNQNLCEVSESSPRL